jgi:hypothetical protein
VQAGGQVGLAVVGGFGQKLYPHFGFLLAFLPQIAHHELSIIELLSQALCKVFMIPSHIFLMFLEISDWLSKLEKE